jgi:NDP-sugar pyrophosphorylase family protein
MGRLNDVTAVLLCGGKGERLRPYTESVPKALVPIKSKPLLYHLMRYICAGGITRFVICTGYLGHQIEAFVRECGEFGEGIVCVNSGDVPMTDRILDAEKHLSERTLICYGDTLANVDLAALESAHTASGSLATVTLYPFHSPFGVVETGPSGHVTVFREKPVLPYWINIGFLLCERGGLTRMRRGENIDGFLAALCQEGLLFAYQHGGSHLTINTERERALAEAQSCEFLTLVDELKA